jgi:hypothetical protein
MRERAMAIRFIISYHGSHGYALELTGYEALLPTITAPQVEAHTRGLFPSEATCAAYLRDRVGISAERIADYLGDLAEDVMTPISFLPLSDAEAWRVLTHGYPPSASLATTAVHRRQRPGA